MNVQNHGLALEAYGKELQCRHDKAAYGRYLEEYGKFLKHYAQTTEILVKIRTLWGVNTDAILLYGQALEAHTYAIDAYIQAVKMYLQLIQERLKVSKHIDTDDTSCN